MSDFDGTIANSDLTYSNVVRDAIRIFVKKGFSFSIASGRPYFGIIKQACEDLGLTSPQIVSGGSAIIIPKTGEYIWKQPIEQKMAKALISLFLRKDYKFGLENENYVFTPNGMEFEAYGPNVDFCDIKSYDFKTPLKIVLLDANSDNLYEVGDEIANQYPELHLVRGGVHIERSVIDITSQKGTKHLATLELQKILKIDKNRTIGIGDGYNDYPLLTACGYKVAMGNAASELKEIADLVVADVKHDGLVEVIYKLIPAKLAQ